jgi:hypothetical protein
MLSQRNRPALLLALILLAVLGYYLPWWAGRAAALSANAYDLAEYITPIARYANPPLLGTFELRTVFAGLALLLGLHAAKFPTTRAIAGLGAALITLTLLPPPDFFIARQWDDINYRQQFLITVGTALLFVAIWGLRKRSLMHGFTLRWIALIVVILALAGEINALQIVGSLKIDAPVGVGVALVGVSLGALSLLDIRVIPGDAP